MSLFSLDYLKIPAAVLAVETAVASRSATDLETAAVSLAAIAGIQSEAAAVVAVVEDARRADWSAALKDVEPLLEEVLDAVISHKVFGATADEATVGLSAQVEAIRCVRRCAKRVRSAQ